MSIFPLPLYESDLAEAEREAFERLKPPTSMVVRFGAMRLIGEYPYRGDQKPGCGSKIVAEHAGVRPEGGREADAVKRGAVGAAGVDR